MIIGFLGSLGLLLSSAVIAIFLALVLTDCAKYSKRSISVWFCYILILVFSSSIFESCFMTKYSELNKDYKALQEKYLELNKPTIDTEETND